MLNLWDKKIRYKKENNILSVKYRWGIKIK